MRQNFVIKKDEQKGKHTAITIIDVIAVLQFIIGLLGVCVTGMAESFIYGLISCGIFSFISCVISLSINYEYHGCYGMEGFMIDCVLVNGKTWNVRVNNVLLPKVSSADKKVDKFECKINNISDFEVYCQKEPLTVTIKIDGLIIVEDDVVYVDKIKQALNMY